MITELLIDIMLFTLLVILGVAITRLSDLFMLAILASLFSLVAACLYVTMDAVDVAFTEAAVGSGVSTLLFMSAIALTTNQAAIKEKLCLSKLFIVVLTGLLLMYGISDIPAFGDGSSPVHQYLSSRYITESPAEIGVPNMVTSILASYRGYDTMGEVAVIFTAGIGVLILLGHGRHRRKQEDM